MTGRSLTLRRRAGALLLAAAPVTMAVAMLWPCVCPGHQPGGTHRTHGTATAAHRGHAMPAAQAALGEPQPALPGALAFATVPVAWNPGVPLTKELVDAANARLSARCRRLVRTTRVRSLSARDRSRRSRCFAERRTIISELARAGATPQTPAAGAGCSGEPCVGAVGVRAIDNGIAFALTRSSVAADVVVFELENADRQLHNLAIAPTDSLGNVNGPTTTLIPDTPPVDPSLPARRPSAEVALQPGAYLLSCTLPGHGPMSVRFTVRAPGMAA